MLSNARCAREVTSGKEQVPRDPAARFLELGNLTLDTSTALVKYYVTDLPYFFSVGAVAAVARSDCHRYRITPTQMPESATLNVGYT
jgi:hypothetical protein